MEFNHLPLDKVIRTTTVEHRDGNVSSLGLIPRLSTWSDGTSPLSRTDLTFSTLLPSSELTEHREIASVVCLHVALSGLY
jgi:hypothetical protein